LSWINQGTASILTGATLGSTAPYVQTGATARTLLQGGTLSVPSGARITQGRLEGDGTINGKLELGGEMLPGGAGKIHVLRINGGYSQTASAIVHVDLERTPQVKQNDQVVITGQANFAGVGTLDVKWISPPQPVATDSFAVFTYASPSGKFKTHKLPPLTPPRSWAPPAYGATALNLKVQ
ncbi:MAG: hypothetical protein ACE5F1_14180, partial [Planctomycetota bacterium]